MSDQLPIPSTHETDWQKQWFHEGDRVVVQPCSHWSTGSHPATVIRAKKNQYGRISYVVELDEPFLINSNGGAKKVEVELECLNGSWRAFYHRPEPQQKLVDEKTKFIELMDATISRMTEFRNRFAERANSEQPT